MSSPILKILLSQLNVDIHPGAHLVDFDKKGLQERYKPAFKEGHLVVAVDKNYNIYLFDSPALMDSEQFSADICEVFSLPKEKWEEIKDQLDPDKIKTE